MERISSLRKRIDEIDGKILGFLKERLEVSKRIGRTKMYHGVSLRDYEREDEVYTNVTKTASLLGLNPPEVKAVYREIIAMSIRAQESETKTR